MPFINSITNGLTDKMITDGKHLKAVLVENVVARANIGIVAQSFVHFKVVAPASNLNTIVTKGFCLGTQGVEGQIGPLATKKGNWS